LSGPRSRPCCPEQAPGASGKSAMRCNHEQDRIVSPEDVQKRKDLLDSIQPSFQKYGIEEVLLINAEDICVAEWVHLKCKYGCNRYGKSWCCPPETPTPEQTRALLSSYERALLLCGSTKSSEFERKHKRRKQVQLWKSTVAIERRLFLSGYYKAFALVAESCALCKDCLYPHDCRFPAERRPSVEAFSIDVCQTLKNVGKKFQIAEDVREEHHYYSIILLE
jgi:predicted metal-binding protein